MTAMQRLNERIDKLGVEITHVGCHLTYDEMDDVERDREERRLATLEGAQKKLMRRADVEREQMIAVAEREIAARETVRRFLAEERNS